MRSANPAYSKETLIKDGFSDSSEFQEENVPWSNKLTADSQRFTKGAFLPERDRRWKCGIDQCLLKEDP